MTDVDLSRQNLGPTLDVIAWLFAAVATIVVFTRYYVRLSVKRSTGIDDWIILLTLALALCDSAFCSVAVHWGLGRHIQFLTPQQIKYSIKWVYLCEVPAIMSPCFGRISYALLLLELIPPTRWRRRLLWTIISIQFVVDVGTVIVSFSQCRPLAGFWDKNIDVECWPAIVQQYTGYFQGSVCSAVDLVLALFPASLFWNLKMKVSAKISLSVLMGLGVFAMIASIVKTVQLRAITEKGDATCTYSSDSRPTGLIFNPLTAFFSLGAMSILAISWTLEAYLVLLAASIPTLRPLLGSKTKSSIKSTTIKPTCAANSWHSDDLSNGHHPPCHIEDKDIFFSLKYPCTIYSHCDGNSNSKKISSAASLPKVGGGGRGGGTGGVNFSRILERSRGGGGEVSEEDRKVIKMETKMSVVYQDVNV